MANRLDDSGSTNLSVAPELRLRGIASALLVFLLEQHPGLLLAGESMNAHAAAVHERVAAVIPGRVIKQSAHDPDPSGPRLDMGGALLFVTTSSFAIRELRHGQLSLLHVLSVVTLVSLIIGVVAIRRGNVGRHRGAMRGSWFGLIGAFIGAVAVPERRIPTFAVADPAGVTLAAVTIVALTFGVIWLAHRFDRHFASSPDLRTDRRRTTDTPAPTSGTVGAADAADA